MTGIDESKSYMGTGIQVCGLNGSGKSTLGKALAEKIGYHFIDNENLFFARTDVHDPYINPRSRAEVEKLLMEEVNEHENFVFAAVKGDYGADILPCYDFIVMIEVPKEIRMQRVRERSFRKFGKRMLPGGDLYEEEEDFFRMIEGRADCFVENWLKTIHCPVVRVDGTRSIEENVDWIIGQIHT